MSSEMVVEAFALVLVFVMTAYMYLTRNFDYWSKKGVPSIPNPYPIVGNCLESFMYRKTMGECFKDMYFWNRDAPFVGFYLVDKPALLLRDPQLIKQVFVRDFAKFADRIIKHDPKVDPIGSNLLSLMPNPKWKHSRLKLSPTFSASKLRSMLPVIEKIGNDFVNYLDREIASNEDFTYSKEVCTKFTVELVVECLFGLKAHCFEKEESVFRKLAKELLAPKLSLILRQSVCFLCPSVAKFFKIRFFDENFYRLVDLEFSKVFVERKFTKTFRNDLIDTFVKFEEEGCDKNDLEFEKEWMLGTAAAFFIGGFETSSQILSSTLFELCLNQDIQRRLREEIRENFPQEEYITIEGLESLSYLSMVIAESMRKYPIIHFISRICLEDYKIEGSDVVIEKGTSVFLPLFGLHYDPKYFPEPDKYDPERFSDKNKEKLVPYTWVPFGEGPRNCIGKRLGYLFVAFGLVKILSNFEVLPSENTPKSIRFNPKLMLLSPIGGLPIKFKKM